MKKHTTLIVILISMAIVACGCGWLATAFATTIEDIQAEAESSSDPLQTYRDKQAELREKIEQLEEQIKKQKNLMIGLEKDIAMLDAQMSIVQSQIDAGQKAIEETGRLIDELDIQIADAEKRLKIRMDLLEERLVNVYIYGDLSMLDVVFDTASFSDFITLYDMVELIVEQDKSLAEQITEERKKIEADKDEQVAYMADLVELQQDYEDNLYDLAQLEQEKQKSLNDATMTIAEYQAYEDSLAATAEAASEKIRELLNSSDSTLSYGGYMIWPLPASYDSGNITSPYGWRTHPVYGDRRFHAGIDIGVPGGTPIYATADGKIILREYYGGYGNCIMIDHGDGVVSLYAHQRAFGDFSVGDYVVAGDVVGYVGTTGTSTGNHLHFEVRLNGSYVSPWDYLQ